MIKLLQTAYPSHYGAKWKDVYSVRFEHTYFIEPMQCHF